MCGSGCGAGTVPSFIGVGWSFRKQQAVHTMAYPGSTLSGAYSDNFYGSLNSNIMDPRLRKSNYYDVCF